jgi:hypothetical protein
MVGALDLDRANAVPGSYVDVPALAAGSLAPDRVTAPSWAAKKVEISSCACSGCC